MNRQNKNKRHDSRYVKRSLDRGPVEFKTRIPEKESAVMKIGEKDVVTIPKSITIIGAAKSMLKHGFRRLPITDPGTNKLKGIITSMDIVRLLGGGDSYQLIKESNSGNLYKGINEEVNQIMNEEVFSVDKNDSIEEAISLIVSTGTGGVPIVDKENKVIGIITERDVVRYISDLIIPSNVENYMSKDVIRVDSSSKIKDVTKTMVNESFRRIPIVDNSDIRGIVTATDIVRFLGSGNIFNKLKTVDIEEALNVEVSRIMSKDLISVNKEAKLSEAAKLMNKNDIGSIPILEDNAIIGILTEHDLVKSIVEG